MFSILLFNTNNSISHLSFDYTLLKDQTVLFQAIYFSISQFYLTYSYHFIWFYGATTPVGSLFDSYNTKV